VEKARKLVEVRPYKLGEAAELLKKTHHTKFNETVELAINLGVDPKHSDQVVRGTVGLPNGLGKTVRVLVIAAVKKFAKRRKPGRISSAATKSCKKSWKAGRITTP